MKRSLLRLLNWRQAGQPTAKTRKCKTVRTYNVQRVQLNFEVEPAYDTEWGEGEMTFRPAVKAK